jgi:hypothetical protein
MQSAISPIRAGILVFSLCLLTILLGLSWIRQASQEAHAGQGTGSQVVGQKQAVIAPK